MTVNLHVFSTLSLEEMDLDAETIQYVHLVTLDLFRDNGTGSQSSWLIPKLKMNLIAFSVPLCMLFQFSLSLPLVGLFCAPQDDHPSRLNWILEDTRLYVRRIVGGGGGPHQIMKDTLRWWHIKPWDLFFVGHARTVMVDWKRHARFGVMEKTTSDQRTKTNKTFAVEL